MKYRALSEVPLRYIMINFLYIGLLLMAELMIASPLSASENRLTSIEIGTPKEVFLEYFPKVTARTYRKVDDKEWLTYDFLQEESKLTITFYLLNDKISKWVFDDRAEIAAQYLSEFCSQSFIQHFTKVYDGIKNALMKIPYDIFLEITDRSKPMLFSETYSSGMSRYAGSSNIRTFPDDAPAFMDGLTIVKLSVEMNKARDVQAIEGVILHEIAHRVLKHSLVQVYSKEYERAANQQVIDWGYEKEFLKAKEQFGVHKKQDLNAQ